MAPKARQAKGRARLTAYDKLLAEAQADEGRGDRLEISIPPGDRLGDQVIEVEHLAKGYGDRLLIEDLSFSLPKAGIVGVIGPNGAGKTTLFRMLTGQEQPDAGSVTVGDSVQLAYVDQCRDSLDADATVYEEITGGQDTFKVGNREIHGRAYVAGFNFKGSDQQKRVGDLSGGERNRVHLAKLLRTGGNVLLLDEPTNDLDVDTLRALEDALEAFPGCAVVISHDRWFLDRICTHVLAFEGDSQVRWFEGNFTEYEAFRHKQLGAERRHAPPHQVQAPGPVNLKVLRVAVVVVCIGGIAGMIVGSVAGNNNGVVITFGLVTAVVGARADGGVGRGPLRRRHWRRRHRRRGPGRSRRGRHRAARGRRRRRGGGARAGRRRRAPRAHAAEHG